MSFFGHCLKEGGGPYPIFLALFYHVSVPKIVHSKPLIFVGYLVIFCHHYHQNYQNFDQNYHGNNYYHHQYFFPPYAQNVVFVGRKKSVKLPKLGGGGGGVWVIRAMPELKSFFRIDVFP